MDPVNPNSHRKRNYNNACYAPSTLSHAEARRIRKRVLDQRKLALAGSSMPSQHTPTLQCGHFDPDFVKTIKASYHDRSYYGRPSYQCIHCSALFWHGERIRSSVGTRSVIYNSCCKGGKVRIPAYRPRPEPLLSLARFDGDVVSKTFMQNIRQYNCLFAFTSMGAHIDRSLNDGRGPPVFKDKLRIENLQGISDAVSRGCINGEEMGKTIVLPASHIGGRRYMIQNYHDSIAICRVHGPPDFFVTFTCNAKWPEIIESLYHCGQKNSDAPDIAIRIFHMKLQELLHDIKSGNIFGPCKVWI
ncbi:Helicase [Zea mays]|uniref:Helicase n=2 Tax=Zea mays TaxID=4577 RepID=A0A1D6G6R4_MAIZE|nr:Helicase [Zea mays]